MDGARLFGVADHVVLNGKLMRPMGAALILRFAHARLGQHAARPTDMSRLAIVRSAGQRQLFGAEAETVGRTAFDHRQALECLDCRTRKDGLADVTGLGDQLASRVHHSVGAGVTAFDYAAAGDFDDHRIRHSALP